MRIWILSDTHFNHEKIKEYENRPDDFNELIVANWQELIRAEDLVIHLGDVAFTGFENWKSYIPQLPGRKILVKGNHDQKSIIWYMRNGFDFCCNSFSLRYHGKNILFTHIPVRYLPVQYDLNIHGHVHTRRKSIEVPRQVAIRIEETGYKPVLLKTLIY